MSTEGPASQNLHDLGPTSGGHREEREEELTSHLEGGDGVRWDSTLARLE